MDKKYIEDFINRWDMTSGFSAKDTKAYRKRMRVHLKKVITSAVSAERKRCEKCQSCGKPLSRDCPRCKRMWES